MKYPEIISIKDLDQDLLRKFNEALSNLLKNTQIEGSEIMPGKAGFITFAGCNPDLLEVWCTTYPAGLDEKYDARASSESILAVAVSNEEATKSLQTVQL